MITKVGEKLKKYRALAGINQTELARRLDVSSQSLAVYEKDSREPRTELRLKFAEAMELDPVEMCMELSEDDEIRLFNRLLVKYSKDIATNEDGEVVAVLPENFIPLQREYKGYVSGLELIKQHSNEAESSVSHHLNFNPEEMFEFWLEVWPRYDYIKQEVFTKSEQQALIAENADDYHRFAGEYLKKLPKEARKKFSESVVTDELARRFPHLLQEE